MKNKLISIIVITVIAIVITMNFNIVLKGNNTNGLIIKSDVALAQQVEYPTGNFYKDISYATYYKTNIIYTPTQTCAYSYSCIGLVCSGTGTRFCEDLEMCNLIRVDCY
jgi:hypothetical protein